MTFSHLPPPGVRGHIWGPGGPSRLSHPARASLGRAGMQAGQKGGGWAFGYHAGCCWGRGRLPSRGTVKPWGVALCPTVWGVCVCVCVCARLTYSPVVALGMSSCPRHAPACSPPGSGEMVVPGRPSVQNRVGSCPLGLAAAHSFPQCPAMPGCPGPGWGW